MKSITDYKLKEFFQKDILDFKIYPEDNIANYYKCKRKNTIVDLTTISSIQLRQEMKDFIKLIFIGNASFSHTSRYMPELFFFLAYIRTLEISSIFSFSEEEMIHEYLSYRNVKEEKLPKCFINTLYFHLTQLYDPRIDLDRDIWNLSDYKIEEFRLNPSSRINTISFIFIQNDKNKELLKKYTKYLFSCTSYSISTITNILNICGNFSNYLKKSILEVTSLDCEHYFHEIAKTIKRSDVFNKHVSTISNFINYLISHDIFSNTNPIKGFKKTQSYKYLESALSDFVIEQIFAKLHLAAPYFQAMYILNFCTGMRISDICQLKTDCLFRENNHYFIKHFVQKMKKFQANIIPKSVYDIVTIQIKEVKRTGKKGNLYIFPSPKNMDLPCSTQLYRRYMKKYMDDWGITNEDGTPYSFKPHAYRHTIASDLLENYNVDLSIIQLGVLGHSEINMSLCYAERRKDRKQRYQTIYVDINGNSNHLKDLLVLEERAENMILPNGICMNPSKLGICPHYEACLNCQFFRTSIDYLELHKQHLTNLQKKLVIYENNNLKINYITTKKEIDGLKKIINTLLNIP